MYVNNKPDIREKTLKYGLGYPLDEELVMLILGSGSRQMSVQTMARKIVDVLNSGNSSDMVERLLKMKGVGQGKALAVAAAIEFGKRRTCHLGAHISSPSDLIPFVNHYAMNGKEHFLAVTLNGGHNIIQIHVVSIGTTNRALIHPREVFGEAIRENATALILCHNHPSGHTEPSPEDIEATNTLVEASKIIGIPILDHIIIDCNSYFSFKEKGLLPVDEQ
ncbi:MAG: DNA repair protein RadC [Treponema sp.]|nr:DNA repair protein RadC [Treponema sp.]